jgi:sulfite exporter TauE/SafE
MTGIETGPFTAALLAAFMAGLLGSGHCFGMCGGIAGSLGAFSGLPGQQARYAPTLQFNLGRLLSYGLLGALTAGVLGGVGDLMALKSAGKWLRILTALMVLLIGMRFLLEWRGLDWIERGGARLWRRIMPLAVRVSSRHDWIGRMALGLCWGFIPCGLVYSVLLTAASTGSAAPGALVMLAFGTGTLPAMVGLGVAAPALNTFLSDRMVRRIIGFSLVVLALWMMFTIFPWSSAPHHGHHQGTMMSYNPLRTTITVETF